MNQSPDAEILQSATDDDRVVITADLDFPRLPAKSGSDGPGLILLRDGNYSEAESQECVRRDGVRARRVASIDGGSGPLQNPPAIATYLTRAGRRRGSVAQSPWPFRSAPTFCRGTTARA